MEFTLPQERQRAHAPLDLLTPENRNAIQGLLEGIVDDNDQEITVEDRAAT